MSSNGNSSALLVKTQLAPIPWRPKLHKSSNKIKMKQNKEIWIHISRSNEESTSASKYEEQIILPAPSLHPLEVPSSQFLLSQVLKETPPTGPIKEMNPEYSPLSLFQISIEGLSSKTTTLGESSEARSAIFAFFVQGYSYN